MKKQTDIAKKQCQVLEKIHISDKKGDEIINKKSKFKKYKRANIVYSNNYIFYEYDGINKFNCLSFDSKYDLVRFCQNLNKLIV